MERNHQSEIGNILQSIPIFTGMSRNDINTIVPLLQPLTYPAESIIIREGNEGTSMYIIHEGTVKVSRIDEDSHEEIIIGFLGAGSYFGEFSLIDNLPRSATVTTVGKSDIFRLEKKDFDALITANASIATIFYRNCLMETFSRFRNIVSNFTFSQHILKEKTAILNELNKDLSSAKKIQGYFINTEFLDENILHRDITHSYIYQPCRAIGGDFLTVVRIDEHRIGMIIADVEGHGITAALATGVIKSGFSMALHEFGDRPISLLQFLNRHFCDLLPQLYATCYYALIDTKTRTIEMVKAGHHHPLFWKDSTQRFMPIDCTGTILGVLRDAEFGEITLEYRPGDKILFYTDGIIEQINERHHMYSKARLMHTFKEMILRGKKDILHEIYEDFMLFSKKRQFEDDITLMLFEFNRD